MTKISRRRFIQAGSMAAAASVLSGCSLNLQRIEYLESYNEPPEEGLPGESLWYASTCRQCSAGCGIIVRVSNGRPRKIEGNPAHPVNRGKLCARGQAALQELYDPDRLQNAVRQTGGRGSLQFEPMLWDNALFELGNRLQAADPAGIAFLSGNPSSHQAYVARHFMSGLGAPAPLVYSMADELDGRLGLSQNSETVFGSAALPYYDIAQADVVFSFGANFLETWLSPVSQARAYSAMRRQHLGKRGYLVQFEARLSATGASADRWIAIRPGSEGMVALALGKLISDASGERSSWYANVNVDELAYASGVDRGELEHLAAVFSSYERPLAIAGNNVAGQHTAASSLTAVQALNVLTGRLGKPGGVYLAPSIDDDFFQPAAPSSFGEMQSLVEAMRGGRVEVLLIHGFNPAFELPKQVGFAQALDNVPLVVYFGSTVDETAALADMILPDHTSLESWGYQTPIGSDRPAVSGQQPVMQPMYDTRSTVDVLLALAARFGGAARQALPWDNEIDLLEEAVGHLNVTWSQWRRQGGWWAEAAGLQSPVSSLAGIPAVQPVFEGDREQYPYFLHIYPSLALGDGRGANKAWLQEMPDPMTTVAWQSWVEINPETADELGLADNDVVQVISPAGSIEAIVYRYPGVPRDLLAMAVGRGHQQYGRFARGMGSNPLEILVAATTEPAGTLAWGATRVRLEKTDRSHTLPRLESPEGVEYLRSGGEH